MIKQYKLNDPSKLNLQKSIIATLVWFNMRGRALKIQEIEKLLYKNTSSSFEILDNIKKLKKLITSQNNFYYLKKYQKIIAINHQKQWYKNKWKIAQKAVKIISFLPYIRLIGVVNSVADGTAKPESDIDFLVITKNKRLFLTRFLVTSILQLFRLRRHGKLIKDRICLSWYCTESGMNLSRVAHKEDILLAYLVAQLNPVLEQKGFYHRFLDANDWVKSYLPNLGQDQKTNNPNQIAIVLEKLFDKKLGDWLERICQNHQLGKISKNQKNPDPDVKIIANKNMLKFHEIDRRRIYREMWESGVEEITKALSS